MYYLIYKITNKINGKEYIGSHRTEDIDDGYMGSGKYLKRAIEKHGIEKFTKEILFVYDNPKSMYAKEAEIVNEDYLENVNTYNLKLGGFGGFDYINSNEELTREQKLKWQKAGKEKFLEKYNNDLSFKKTIDERNHKNSKIGKKILKEKYPEGTWKGKKHSDQTKFVMSEKAKVRLKDPSKNSQYGTKWIYSDKEKKSIKIKKTDPIPLDWKEGRKIKF